MNMYQWEDHTADARLIIRGTHQEDLFQQGLLGMYAFMEPVKTERVAPLVNLDLKGRDRAQLLVDFLSSVITWSAVNKAHYHTLIIHQLEDNHLVALLEGHCVDRFGKDIKAATHHDVVLHKIHGGYEACIIFDI